MQQAQHFRQQLVFGASFILQWLTTFGDGTISAFLIRRFEFSSKERT